MPLLAVGLTACQSLYIGGLGRGEMDKPLPPANRFVLPSSDTDVVGELRVVIARQEDTLSDIARRHDLGYEEVVAANPGVDPWLPGAGTRVVLPTRFILPAAPHDGLVLNLASMRLFYYPKPRPGESRQVITHPIGIGREGWATPQGTTRIVAKTANPVWYVPASVREEHARDGNPLPAAVPAGPDNPLGAYALRLGIPSYLIHGTNKPYGVGMRVSHGCVRLYPEDIERLFPQVPVGTPVRIVNQPYLAGWDDGVLHLEAHQPLEEQTKRWGASLKPMIKVVKGEAKRSRLAVDWPKAERVAREARGVPVPISPGSRDFEELVAAAPVIGGAPERWEGGARESAPRLSSQRWYVQAGVFRSPDNAKRLAAALTHLGPMVPAQAVADTAGYRVLAGPYQTRAAAQAGERRIRQALDTDTLILSPGDPRLN